MKELAALAYRDTTQENRDYWKNEMAGALREIQACYDEKLDVMKGELDTFYNLKVSCCVAKTLGVVRLWPLGSPKLCRNHQMAPIIKSTDMPGAATTPKNFTPNLSEKFKCFDTLEVNWFDEGTGQGSRSINGISLLCHHSMHLESLTMPSECLSWHGVITCMHVMYMCETLFFVLV